MKQKWHASHCFQLQQPEGREKGVTIANQKKLRQQIQSLLKPALVDTLLHHFSTLVGGGPVHYADFGCSVGHNTISFATFVTDILNSKSELSAKDFVCHFADLPSNDFNTLFKQLPGEGGGERERTWFVEGVPGSQYSRMFPHSSLHVAMTTLTLHYLSEIPSLVSDKSLPVYNKGKISAHGSSLGTVEAYVEVSRKGLRKFFECRAEEMVSSGVLGYYCPGRRDRAHPEEQMFDDNVHPQFLFEKSWQELVNEGTIEEEILDSFNMPICHPSIDELQEAIEQPIPEFQIQTLEFTDKFYITPGNADTMFKDAKAYGETMTNMLKMGAGPMVSDHLGHEPMQLMMERFCHNSEKDYPLKKAVGFPMYVSFCSGVLVQK
ncbi:hypothetical protein KC19_5G072700 [Ceratodon purpureus]|uniref:Uncharacterized protein n=1 Tax=Ceratodon purpureus TaxID=3225 RepID=A0A8T0HYT2_CERPU|nr:hypothetical protein KC19_5G072700 [Ceratodon purpureus]